MRSYRKSKYRLVAAALAVGLAVTTAPAFARPLDPGCEKIEGAAIGSEGVALRVGDVTITFHEWQAKPGNSHEYVGFAYSTSGGQVTDLTIKAGRDRHPHDVWNTFGSWTHPDGDTGKAVSHVVVCAGVRTTSDVD
jgi:hypothetical protein